MAAYQGFEGPTGASAHRARDIEAHKRAEEALRLIVEGVFSVTGEQFVRALLGQVGPHFGSACAGRWRKRCA